MIKTALLYLVVGLALAIVRAAQSVGVVAGSPALLWLPQLHLLTVGWLTQLIFGVAFWLFPAVPDDSFDWAESAIWIGYGTLNLGLILRVLAEPPLLSPSVKAWGVLASAGLQWIASLLFVAYFWRRVRTK